MMSMDFHGGLAQLGEHLLCTQGVKGSNPLIYTIDSKMNRKMYLENRTTCEKQCNTKERDREYHLFSKIKGNLRFQPRARKEKS